MNERPRKAIRGADSELATKVLQTDNSWVVT